MNELDKLRVMLPHWIEHNSGHGREFSHWADLLKSSGQDEIAGLMNKAETCLKEAEAVLQEALQKAGGPVVDHDGHHHHHHHSEPE